MLFDPFILLILKDTTSPKYTYINIHFSNHNPNCSLPIFPLPTLTLCSHTSMCIKHIQKYSCLPFLSLYREIIKSSYSFIKGGDIL